MNLRGYYKILISFPRRRTIFNSPRLVINPLKSSLLITLLLILLSSCQTDVTNESPNSNPLPGQHPGSVAEDIPPTSEMDFPPPTTLEPAPQILSDLETTDLQQTWSPDSQKIAFVAHQQPESAFEFGSQEIYIVNRDGSQLTLLTSTSDEWETFPQWSPDGRQIAYVSYSQGRKWHLNIMNSDGSNPTRLLTIQGE